MTDREAIIDRITDLFVATDERDWVRVRASLAPQVVLDMTSLAGGETQTLTPEAVASGWKTGLSAVKSVHHQIGNFRVTIHGDETDAFCYGIAFHHTPGLPLKTFVGSDDIHLRRDGDTWRVDLFRFKAKFVE